MSKKPRPPMKRTTSLKEFNFNLAESPPSDPPSNPFKIRQKPASFGDVGQQQMQSGGFPAPMVLPSSGRRGSGEFEMANFLRSCSLCKRRLVAGRDLYMYRGNTAFCSNECRQQQMNQDESKEKCSSSSSSPISISNSTKAESVTAL